MTTLKLFLENDGRSWTLRPNREYIIGSGSDCQISLPEEEIASQQLKFNFNSRSNLWYVYNLDESNATYINNQRIYLLTKYPITNQSRISVGNSLAFVATPERNQDTILPQLSTNSPLPNYNTVSSQAVVSSRSFQAKELERRTSESTRYLCVAVQIDEKFCDQVLEEFLEKDYTAIGICHGVDLPTVLKSCLLAKERRRKRNIPLAILSFASFLFFFIFFPLFLILYCVAWIIVFLDQLETRYEIVGKHLLKGNFNPDFLNFPLSPKAEKKLKEIAETQDANVIIYGDFSPFVGSGINIGGWSFAIDISKGKEDMGSISEPLSFQVSELYDYVTNSINRLNLENLSIEDNLYVNGQEIRDRDEFLPNLLMRPITKLKDTFVKSFVENPTHFARHYKCVRVTDWQGELILSIFLRFSRIGQNLFVEANYYLLTPLSKYYRQFDQIKPEPSSEDIRKLALGTIFKTVSFGLASLTSIFQGFSDSRRRKKQRKEKEKEIKSNYAFNYGAITSLRERVSYDNAYNRYFQKLDKEMYLKSIERRIIDGLSKFLDSKNIDTSDFKEAKSTILNNGVIVSGGSLQAQSLTVGERAKSIFSSLGSGGGASGTSGSASGTSDSK